MGLVFVPAMRLSPAKLMRMGGHHRMTTSHALACLSLLMGSTVVGCHMARSGRDKLNTDWYPSEGACLSSRKEVLKEIEGIGVFQRGQVSVHYPQGLEQQAEGIARQINDIVRMLEEQVGIMIPVRQFEIYLKRAHDARPGTWCECAMTFDAGGSRLILLVPEDDPSLEHIAIVNLAYTTTYVHELVELSLSRWEDDLPVLLDYRHQGADGVVREEMNYTRWFREGMGDYCVCLAHKMMFSDSGSGKSRFSAVDAQQGLRCNPFAMLSRIAGRLFVWSQYHEDSQPFPQDSEIVRPDRPLLAVDYYEASLGLFLLIEDLYGRDAIKKINQAVLAMDRADKQVLIRTIDQVLGADIVELVDSFRFPETGIGAFAFDSEIYREKLGCTNGLFVEYVLPGSAAERAGIRIHDVIRGMQGQPVLTELDFDRALFKWRHEPSVEVDLWREKEGRKLVRLDLVPRSR